MSNYCDSVKRPREFSIDATDKEMVQINAFLQLLLYTDDLERNIREFNVMILDQAQSRSS